MRVFTILASISSCRLFIFGWALSAISLQKYIVFIIDNYKTKVFHDPLGQPHIHTPEMYNIFMYKFVLLDFEQRE